MNLEKKNVGSVAMNRGTKITVERIFQNVPARLKYMKSINAEFAAIYSYVERLASLIQKYLLHLFMTIKQYSKQMEEIIY